MNNGFITHTYLHRSLCGRLQDIQYSADQVDRADGGIGRDRVDRGAYISDELQPSLFGNITGIFCNDTNRSSSYRNGGRGTGCPYDSAERG